jgi:ATP-dependent DNA ligase
MKAMKPLHLYKEEAKKTPKHLGHEYMIFEKYDGWYGYYENGHIHSFADRIIPSVQWLADKLEEQFRFHGITGRLVFEILLSDVEDFHTLNGILNRRSEAATTAYLRVHDYLPETSEEHTNSKRYELAEYITNNINLKCVKIAPVLEKSSDVSKWREVCFTLWAQGAEGIIAKQCDGLYKWGGRDATMLKIKLECTFEAVVVGLAQGKANGKYETTLGALLVRTSDDVVHTVSGMTDRERELWWSDHNQIVGAVVECQAMQKLTDGTYREPRYKAVRHDKNFKDID